MNIYPARAMVMKGKTCVCTCSASASKRIANPRKLNALRLSKFELLTKVCRAQLMENESKI